MAQESRVLRQLSISDLFDEVFSLYRKNFWLLFGVTGLAYIPVEIILKVIQSPPAGRVTPEEAFGYLSTALIGILFYLLAVFLAQAALTKAISERYLGHPTSILSAYSFVLQRFFPFLGTLILVGLAYTVGFIAFFIGALFVGFMLAFVFPVFVVEDRAYGDAMGRSRRLAQGNWGRIFLIALVTVLLNAVIGLAGVGLNLWLFGLYPTGIQAVLSGALEGMASAILLPISLTAFVLLYFDIRVRKEGYDLEVLAQEMAARTGEGLPRSTPPTGPPS